MPQSDTAAPAWPDEVVAGVEAAIRAIDRNDTRPGHAHDAHSILAAIAPHVAASVAAAERRGREDAVEICKDEARMAAAMRQSLRDGKSRDAGAITHCCGAESAAKLAASRIAALPPSNPGASALAEEVRRAVEAEREACAAEAISAADRYSGFADGVEADAIGDHIAAAIRQRGAGGGTIDE